MNNDIDKLDKDIENKKINDLTLQYFSNKNYLNQKTINQNNKSNNDVNINKKEIKFYRKRIMDFTKKMLRNEIDLNNINNNIEASYYEYINVLIEDFKINDKRDLLQAEFNNFITDVSMSNNIKNDINNLENINNLLMQKKEVCTIDNFVLKTKNKKEKKVYPQEKKINLKAKYLRDKGIKK